MSTRKPIRLDDYTHVTHRSDFMPAIEGEGHVQWMGVVRQRRKPRAGALCILTNTVTGETCCGRVRGATATHWRVQLIRDPADLHKITELPRDAWRPNWRVRYTPMSEVARAAYEKRYGHLMRGNAAA